MIKKLPFLCLAVLFAGCSHWQMRNAFEKLMYTTIQLPAMEVVLNGKSVDSFPRDEFPAAKLVVYYTSAKGCLSCWISHLYDLERTFEFEINNAFTPMIVIAAADNNYEEIRCLLESQPHAYPVYIDRGGVFEQKNPQLPADIRFHTFLLDKNVVQSMSRRGNCWDNAVAESFFKTLKCELIYGNQTLTPIQLELELFEYIEIWYNKIRRHSALKNMTIDEFWKLNKISA